jgi:dipeptidyl aminopeptidase/acylaminoacyl peptidase
VGAVCLWDVASQKLQGPIWTNPEVTPNSLVESLDGRSVVGVRSMPGMPAVTPLVAGADTIKVIVGFSARFPGESVDVVSSTDDGSKAVVLVSSDADPGTYYLWDVASGKGSVLLQRAPWIHPAAMAVTQPVDFKARDGLALHGYLSMPPGQEDARHLPLVVLVHGGPFGIRDTWGYDPYVQMLATHGYAVLQVNYRGSGGYGFGFMHAGYREWGGRMQDDVTDATAWAIAQGIGDAGRVCIFGGSYGGYAALEGATREPDLYRCAIGYVGVYDLPLMYARGDIPQSMMGTSYLHDALGDDRKVMSAHSPINQLDRLKAQVMLVVGGVDKRVPPVQGENLHRALLDRHVAHEWLYQADEGHGFYSEAHRAELFSRIVAFLDRNIGPAPRATPAAVAVH